MSENQSDQGSLKSGCTAVIIGLSIMFFFAMQRSSCEESQKSDYQKQQEIDQWNREKNDKEVEQWRDKARREWNNPK